MKARFYRQPPEVVIKSIRPWERLSIDFKGPFDGKNKYLLIAVDEYSRQSWASPQVRKSAIAD